MSFPEFTVVESRRVGTYRTHGQLGEHWGGTIALEMPVAVIQAVARVRIIMSLRIGMLLGKALKLITPGV